MNWVSGCFLGEYGDNSLLNGRVLWGDGCVGEPPTFHFSFAETRFARFQAAFGSASKGGATLGCRGLPLLVVGGETPALAKDKACFEAA